MSLSEEVEMELEALRDIYDEELEEVSGEEIKITVKSTQDDFGGGGEDVAGLAVVLRVRFTSTYPEEAPELEVQVPEEAGATVTGTALREMQEKVEEVAQESLGEVMVFNVACALQEMLLDLRDSLASGPKDGDSAFSVESVQEKPFTGTPVTLESFLAWRDRFEAEMGCPISAPSDGGASSSSGKLTGRALFLANSSLFDDREDDDDIDDDSVHAGEGGSGAAEATA